MKIYFCTFKTYKTDSGAFFFFSIFFRFLYLFWMEVFACALIEFSSVLNLKIKIYFSRNLVIIFILNL